jgi:hypothetical protein
MVEFRQVRGVYGLNIFFGWSAGTWSQPSHLGDGRGEVFTGNDALGIPVKAAYGAVRSVVSLRGRGEENEVACNSIIPDKQEPSVNGGELSVVFRNFDSEKYKVRIRMYARAEVAQNSSMGGSLARMLVLRGNQLKEVGKVRATSTNPRVEDVFEETVEIHVPLSGHATVAKFEPVLSQGKSARAWQLEKFK